MKHSPMPPRKSRLSSGTKQLRRGALNRSAENTRAAARKPLVSKPKHDPAEAPARKAVKARSQGRCERCGNASGEEYSHRKARSQGGLFCPSNALWACARCHRDMHTFPALSYERGWHVRSTQNPAEVAVWLAGRGWSYLTADGGITPVERNAA